MAEQPSSQRLRERNLLSQDAMRAFDALIGEVEAAGDKQKKTGWMSLSWHRRLTWLRWLRELRAYVENLHTMRLAHEVAALAAPEASPQPEIARVWFEKGWEARAATHDRGLDASERAAQREAAYLAAHRQESPQIARAMADSFGQHDYQPPIEVTGDDDGWG
jgi:hypothetical protein